MMAAAKRLSLGLLGPFRLLRPEGERIEIPSKKGVAGGAMLAMARDGERTRGWLQDKLWGKRQHAEGRGSLRRELSNLRKLLNRNAELLICTRDRVRLHLDLIEVDARLEPEQSLAGEFLEGLDIAGEDGFEEWLREQRNALARAAREAIPFAGAPAAAPPLPAHIVDTSRPPIGFEGSAALAVMPFLNMTGDAQNKTSRKVSAKS